MTIPNYLPFLRSGTGLDPSQGGCLVQVAGFLYDGKSWDDMTPCVHRTLRGTGIRVNDAMTDEKRPMLSVMASRIAGSAYRVPEDWTDEQQAILSIRLSCRMARFAIRPHPDSIEEEVISAVEHLCDDMTDANKWRIANLASQRRHEGWFYAYKVQGNRHTHLRTRVLAGLLDAAQDAAALKLDLFWVGLVQADTASVDLCEGDSMLLNLYTELVNEFDRLTGTESHNLTPEQGETIRSLSDEMKVEA